MNSKGFWYFLQFGAIVLDASTIALGYWLFPNSTLYAWSIFAGLMLFHVCEIPGAVKIAGEKNVSPLKAAAKTFLFGFTWWLPLKKGITTS
jgi:hypothetical protein